MKFLDTKHTKSKFYSLPRKEFLVSSLLIQNFSNEAIAQELDMSPSSVSDLKRKILRKFGVTNSQALLLLAIRSGALKTNWNQEGESRIAHERYEILYRKMRRSEQEQLERSQTLQISSD